MLDDRNITTLCKFRTMNHTLPIERAGGKPLQVNIENVYFAILVILETSFTAYFHVQNSTTIYFFSFFYVKNLEIEQTH